MTGADLKSIRAALAAATGRTVSQDTLGRALGLTGDPARTVRRWEEGDGPTGPAGVALAYLGQGALDATMQRVLPEYVAATALPDGDAGSELVIRLWWPRFIAAVVSAEVTLDPDAEWAWIEPGVERLAVAMWIDDPQAFSASAANPSRHIGPLRDPIDQRSLIERAASMFQESSLDAMEC